MTDHPGHPDPPDAASTGAAGATGATGAAAHDSAAHDADAADARAFRELLRGLRVWDVELPSFDPATAPDEPLPLFRQWLREAAEAGVPEPHTMTLATADASGDPSVRTLMLHDADEQGWHFASHRGSRRAASWPCGRGRRSASTGRGSAARCGSGGR